MRKEAIQFHLRALHLNLLGGTEENNENPLSRIACLWAQNLT